MVEVHWAAMATPSKQIQKIIIMNELGMSVVLFRLHLDVFEEIFQAFDVLLDKKIPLVLEICFHS